jgi:hypothetical protein
MLDSANIIRHVTNQSTHVTESIWIGKLNNIRSRVSSVDEQDRKAIQRIEQGQTDGRIREICDALKNHPLIRWKDSIKRVVGLAVVTEPGLDQ